MGVFGGRRRGAAHGNGVFTKLLIGAEWDGLFRIRRNELLVISQLAEG